MPKASTIEARTFNHRRLKLRPMQPKASTPEALGSARRTLLVFYTYFRAKSPFVVTLVTSLLP